MKYPHPYANKLQLIIETTKSDQQSQLSVHNYTQINWSWRYLEVSCWLNFKFEITSHTTSNCEYYIQNMGGEILKKQTNQQ